MSHGSGSRWAVLSAIAAVPAVLLVSACGNSTSPKGSPTVDSVGVSPTSVIIERYFDGSTVQYYTEPVYYEGDYAEVYNDTTSTGDYRELLAYTLPALHGSRVVDSATVFDFVCSDYSNDAHVTRGTPFPAAQRLSARHATVGHAFGPAGGQPAIMLDHIYFEGSDRTDSTAWGADLMAGSPGTLVAAGDGALGWKAVSVTAAVKADYAAGHPVSQYRIQYASNPGGTYSVDFGGVFCYNDGTAGPSSLVIWSH
jgi:hypothetical protein